MTDIIVGDTRKDKAPVDALDLVADAIMKAYLKQIHEYGMIRIRPSQKSITELFEQSTDSQCRFASLETVGMLATNYPDYFKNLLIISTSLIPEDHVFGGDFEPFHSYFLAEDNKGMWYAASPANHNVKLGAGKDANGQERENNMYATTIFRDRNLNDVLNKIQTRDNLTFPSKKEIETGIRKNSGSFTTDGKTAKVLEAEITDEGMLFSYIKAI
ncbi:MAG TPA: hypothetical protein VKC53_02195 [Patescibacteria group bacterium]|nr:hypothetical protein [Patescibacteria group bacterium]